MGSAAPVFHGFARDRRRAAGARHRGGRLRAVAVAAAAAALLVLSLGGTASGYGPSPAGTWVVSGGTVGGGVVASVVTSGSTAYLGGNFDYVGPETGSFVPVDPATGGLAPPWPIVGGDVYAAIGDGFGGYYIGGSFSSVGTMHVENVAHIFFDGTLDTEWVGGTDGPVYALARSGAGGGVTLYLGGDFAEVDGESHVALAAIDVNGALVPGFDPAVAGAAPIVFALEVDGSTLYVGGSFTGVGGGSSANLGAVDASGAATAWSPKVNNTVFAVAAHKDLEHPENDRVYAGGVFTQVGSPQVARSRVAAFDTTTGAVVTAWNPGADGEVDVIKVSTSGNTVWIGGAFAHTGGAARNAIAALDASGAVYGWNGDVHGTVLAIGLSGENVYAGGHFTTVSGSATRHNFAAFDVDGSLLSAPATTVGGDVWAIAVSGGTVGVGGPFRSAGLGTGANPAPLPRSNAAAIDLTTGEPTSWDPNVDDTVQVLAVSGSTVYAGGEFTAVNGGTPRNRIAAFDASTGAASSWDPNANGSVYAITVLGSTVYFGGAFTKVQNTIARNRAAAFPAADGTTPTAWDPNANGSVLALDPAGSTIYLGGSFTTIRGFSANRLAEVNAGGAGELTLWEPSADGTVFTVTHNASTVYAGGRFTTMNGVARQGVAALDRAGTSTLTSWSPQTSLGAGQGGEVYSLAASASTMYLGGAFRTVNGVASPSLAAVSLETGASLPSWAPAADDAVSWIALAPQGLAVAGSFTALGHPPLGSGALVDEPATTHRGGFALLPALPDAPLAVSAAPAASSASVSFSAPAFDGGTPVTSYTVTASPGGATATGDKSPVVVGGLTNGTAYTFTVTATTAAGVGAASSPSAAVIPRTVPGAPTHVTATATNGQALVTFTHPASDGGAPITSYTLTVSPGGETVSATDGPIWVTGLSNGTSYTFTVTATNSAGTGPAASPSEAVVPVGIGRSHPAPPPPAPRPAAPDVPITAGVRPPAPSESSVPG